jgi:RNA polymerase sigma factor (sigma-70 family)
MVSRIESLCKRAKKADKDAACQLLVEIYYGDIFAYLRRLCGSKQDAEDLTQEAFVKVWCSLDTFASRSKFSTWLHRIAYNTYADWLRRNGRNAKLHIDQWWDHCPNSNPGPFASISERQLAHRLYEAVDQLDEDKKQVVHLHYYQGLSLKETAKVLHIARSTVKYRLREVFKTLRTKIDIQEVEFDQRETT